MVTVNAAAALNGAGSFATSRRGGLSHAEVDAARAKLGSRATAAQIAKYTGRCEADIRPMLSIVVEVETELQAEVRKAAAKAEAKRKADEARDALRMSQDAEFAKLWADRMPIARMATHFGVGFNRVRSWAKRLGLPQRPPGRMNRHRQNPETVAIQRIDSGKRREGDRMREAQIVASARMSTVVAILAVPANDRVRHMEGMLDAIRDQLTVSLDPAGASSIMASKAQQAIISGVTARARAEQLFSGRPE